MNWITNKNKQWSKYKNNNIDLNLIARILQAYLELCVVPVIAV
jgi:hypothetical protein